MEEGTEDFAEGMAGFASGSAGFESSTKDFAAGTEELAEYTAEAVGVAEYAVEGAEWAAECATETLADVEHATATDGEDKPETPTEGSLESWSRASCPGHAMSKTCSLEFSGAVIRK